MQRERLLGAALRLFDGGERSYESIRIADIVGEAGMSSRSFYEFFDSKEDLVVQLVRRIGRDFIDDVLEMRRETHDPVQQIAKALTRFTQIFTLSPVDLRSFGATAQAQIQRVLGEYVREVAAMFHDELVDQHARGRLPRPPNRVHIEVLFEGILAVAVRYFGEGRGGELDELRPGFQELLVRVLL